MSVEQQNMRTIRRVFDEFVNRGDFSVVDEIYRPDVVDHHPLPGAPEGLEGVRHTIEGLRKGFPDLHVTIEAMSAHADHVVIHNTWRGTHLGDFLGLRPTGKRVTSKGIVVWRLDGGRIAERWGIGVDTGMLAQLGVVTRVRGRRGAGAVPATAVHPILPGKLERWRELCSAIAGERSAGYRASRRAAGVTRELLWEQGGGGGVVAVYQWEAADPGAALGWLSTSDSEFDRWMRGMVLEIHGVEPWGAVRPRLVHGWG